MFFTKRDLRCNSSLSQKYKYGEPLPKVKEQGTSVKILFKIFSLCFYLGLTTAFGLPSLQSQELKPLKVYIDKDFYIALKNTLPLSFPFMEEKFKTSKTLPKRQIDWVPFTQQDLWRHLKQEGGKTPADVVVGLDSVYTPVLDAAPFPSMIRESIYFPFQWEKKEFLPIGYGYLAILYDPTRISLPSQSLWEFISVKTDESLFLPDPQKDGIGLAFVSWVMEALPYARKSHWQILRNKIKSVVASHQAAYNLFQKGEAPMMIGYTTIKLAKESSLKEAIPLKMIFYPEGNPIRIFVAYKTIKAAQDPEADKILELFTEPAIQRFIAQTLYLYPVRQEAITPELAKLAKPEQIQLPSLHTPEEILAQWQKHLKE
jgi:thiamine transport system substrate-binding protein